MKVLVAIDSSPSANDLLDEIAKRPWQGDTEFRLVSAVEDCSNWEASEEFTHQAEIILKNRIDRLTGRLSSPMKVEGELLLGVTTPSIVQEAQNWKADLLIIGCHGSTGARRRDNNNIASELVNNAPCSVEVIKLVAPNENH